MFLQLTHQHLLIRETDCEQEKFSAMFNSITWVQYFTVVIILSVCYYAFIGFRYYRWEVFTFIGIKKNQDNTIAIPTVANFKKSFETENDNEYQPKPALEADISPLVQAFTDEIRACLQELGGGIGKDELLHSIQGIITKYPALKDGDYKHDLVQFIFTESNLKYPAFLQLNDLKQLMN